MSGFHVSGLCELVSPGFAQAVGVTFEPALRPGAEARSTARGAERLAEWVEMLHRELEELGRAGELVRGDLRMRTDKVALLEDKVKLLNEDEKNTLARE